MGAPAWHLGRKRAGRVIGWEQRPALYPSGRFTIAEIIKYSWDGGYLISKIPFYRLCQEIVGDLELGQRFRWQISAVECLLGAVEEFMVMTMPGKLNYYSHKINSFTNNA